MTWVELHEEAAEHVRCSRFDQAIALYRSAIRHSPTDPDLLAKLADVYRWSRDFVQAFNHFSAAADLYEREGDPVTALRLFQEANAVSPLVPVVLGRIAHLGRALNNDRAVEAASHQLAKVARCSDPERRAAALGVLEALDPNDADLAERLALTLVEVHKPEKAVEAFRGIARRFSPRRADLLRVLTLAAKAGVDDPILGAGLCRLLLEQSQPRDALTLLVPFYERFPNHVDVLESLVRSLEVIGAAEKIVPARIELVKARVRAGQPEATLADVEALVHMSPGDPVVLEVGAHALAVFRMDRRAAGLWRDLACVRDAEGRRLERDKAILEALKLHPHDIRALELGVEALAQAGRAEESQALMVRLEEQRQAKSTAGRAVAPATTAGPYIEEDVTEALLDGGDAWEDSVVESPPDDPMPIIANPWQQVQQEMDGEEEVVQTVPGRPPQGHLEPSTSYEATADLSPQWRGITNSMQALVEEEQAERSASDQIDGAELDDPTITLQRNLIDALMTEVATREPTR